MTTFMYILQLIIVTAAFFGNWFAAIVVALIYAGIFLWVEMYVDPKEDDDRSNRGMK